jgi:hypothetical protein
MVRIANPYLSYKFDPSNKKGSTGASSFTFPHMMDLLYAERVAKRQGKKLSCVWLESRGSGAERLRSRGCLDGERRERSGSQEHNRSICALAPSLRI